MSTRLLDVYAEGVRYQMGQSSVQNALRDLVNDLERERIDYMLIGALALFAHGYARFTTDIDLVLTPEDLERFRERLEGRGYVATFPGARKGFRATETNTPVEILTTGEYPGDGKPKPVRFPDPRAASVEIDGIRVASLETLIELKLASGMTAPHRLKDLADVQELIKARGLTEELAAGLNHYVREKYVELVRSVRDASGDE
jgi:hypothetical protein